MWLIKLHFLLLSIKLVHSNKETSFPVDELYHQFSSMPSLAHNLHLESELVNGKVTPMALISELLGRQLDEEMFEEYSQMDISSGLKEQNDLLELMENTATRAKPMNDAKKYIEAGLDVLDRLKKLQPVNESWFEDFTKKMRLEFENYNLININFDDSSLSHHFSELLRVLEPFIPSLRAIRSAAVDAREHGIDSVGKEHFIKGVEAMISFAKAINGHIPGIAKQFREGIPSSVHPTDVMGALDPLKQLGYDVFMVHVREPGQLTNMSTSLMQITQDLRALKDVRVLLDELEEQAKLLNEFHVNPNKLNAYKNIGTCSKMLEKVTELESGMDRIEWEVTVLMKRWVPLKRYLKGLESVHGDFFKQLTAIESCFNKYPFTLNVRAEEGQREKLDDYLKKFISLVREFGSALWRLNVNDYGVWQKKIEKWYSQKNYQEESIEKFRDILSNQLRSWELGETMSDVMRQKGRPGNPGKEITNYESLLIQIRAELKTLDWNYIATSSNKIFSKISTYNKLVKCYADLKVVPSDVKTLMDKPKEVWNFDPRPLESAVEVVSLFKGAHKMIGELANWKFEHNPLFKEFPLDSEDVKGINEGFGALEAIRNVRNGWSHIDGTEIEKSDVKDDWNILISSLETFSEELSHVKFRTELPDFQKFISNVHFPNNIQIDPLINFYSTQYKGRRKNEILKYVEYVKQFQMDYPGYSSKLEKMNEAIGKMDKWLEDQKQGVVDEEEEPYVDCAVSYCDRVFTLPAAT